MKSNENYKNFNAILEFNVYGLIFRDQLRTNIR